MKRSGEVAFWCAIGAMVGGIVARAFTGQAWLGAGLGMIAGSVAGYILIDWRDVIAAIPAAYRAVAGWRSPPGSFELARWEGYLIVSCGIHIGIAVTSTALAIDVMAEQRVPPLKEMALFVSLVTFLFVMMTGVGACINAARMLLGQQMGEDDDYEERIADARVHAIALCPPVALFYHLPRLTARYVSRALRWAALVAVPACGSSAVRLVRFLGRFSRELFVRIHSEERLLVGVDAVLGTLVGYVVDPRPFGVLIGMAAGALLGFVNYELVSIRGLRLIPARARRKR